MYKSLAHRALNYSFIGANTPAFNATKTQAPKTSQQDKERNKERVITQLMNWFGLSDNRSTTLKIRFEPAFTTDYAVTQPYLNTQKH
ncbi:MAG: hypothetical protein ABIJ74_04080 [archaeon]